jgi:hypothetical protein
MKAKRLIDEAVSPETVVCYELEDGMQGSYVVGADVKAAKEMSTCQRARPSGTHC